MATLDTVETSPHIASPEELLSHAGWIRGLARRLVADAFTADDVTQDTLLAALEHPPSADRPLRPWLARVLANVVRMRRRGEGRRATHEKRSARGEALPSPEELAERVGLERQVVDAVMALPEPYRATVLLRYFEGLSSAEIARRQGIPAATIRWRLQRGLAALRVELDRDFGGDRRAWCAALLLLADGGRPAAGGLLGILPGALSMHTSIKIAAAGLALFATLYLVVWSDLPSWLDGGRSLDEPEAVSFRPIAEVVEAPDVSVPSSDEATAARSEVEVAEPEPAVATTSAAFATLALRVLDEGGQPIPVATLTLNEFGGLAARSGIDGAIQLQIPPGRRVRTAGIRVGDEPDEPLDPTLTENRLAAPGRATHLIKLPYLRRGDAIDLGDVVLSPGGVVSGRVVDPDGEGIPGARVWVIGVEEVRPEPGGELRLLQLSDPHSSVTRTITDTEGAFAIDGIPAGVLRLCAEKEGTEAAFTGPVEVRGGAESFGLSIELSPKDYSRHLEGIVLSPAGEPVPFAELRIVARSSSGRSTGSTQADEDGHFLLAPRRGGEVTLTAADPEGRWGDVRLEGLEVGDRGLVLRLVERRAVALEVRDERGHAIETFGFHVTLVDEEGRYVAIGQQVESGGGGGLVLPAQAFKITVRAEGFEERTIGPLDPASVPDPVPCELRWLAGLRGRVLHDGEPVAGALVSLFEGVADDVHVIKNGFRSRVSRYRRVTTNSKRDGSFQLFPRSSGEYWLRVEEDGLAPRTHGPLTFRPGLVPEPLEVSLTVGGTLEGRVITESGRSPAGFIVGISRGIGFPRSVRSDSEGRFRFTGLEPGGYQLRQLEEEIRPGSYNSSSEKTDGLKPFPIDFTVHDGQLTRADLDLTGVQHFRLLGRLRLGNRELAGWTARVKPRQGGWERSQATLDGRGAFELVFQQEGEYELILLAPGEQGFGAILDQVRIEAAVTDWSFDVETASISGRTDALDSVEEKSSLVYHWSGEAGQTGLFVIPTDELGGFELEELPVGAGRIFRAVPKGLNPERVGAIPALVEFELRPGESRRLGAIE